METVPASKVSTLKNVIQMLADIFNETIELLGFKALGILALLIVSSCWVRGHHRQSPQDNHKEPLNLSIQIPGLVPEKKSVGKTTPKPKAIRADSP